MIFNWSHSSNNNSNNIDYSRYSQNQLLDQFKTTNWSAMNESQRVGAIQELENRSAAQQGREPAEVVSASRVTSYGSYNSMSNQMNINVNNFSSYETLDTFVHESNHAYQSYCINNGIGYDEYTRNMMGVESARDENGNLYNYARTSPQYDIQCNELDSNNKAADFLISEKDRYKDDQEYKDYIAERDDHFKYVNTALDNNPGMRTSMQNDQAYTSYERGDISEEQYNSLSEDINKPNHINPTVEASHSIGDTISEMNIELYQDNDVSVDEKVEDDSLSMDNDEDNYVSIA